MSGGRLDQHRTASARPPLGGELTGARIAEGIALTSAGTTEHQLLSTNFGSTIAALRGASPDVDVVGASGELDFDMDTEELTSATYQLLEIMGDPPAFVEVGTDP